VTTTLPANSHTRTLTLTRIFPAPRELVFRVWTAPEHLARWWGPEGFSLPVCEMDFRPGGAYRVCMRSPDGADYWVGGVYHEIVAPERIVFSWSHEEEGGTRGHETHVTVTLEDWQGKTKLTLTQSVFESEDAREEHTAGWTDSLNRLDAYLAAE